MFFLQRYLALLLAITLSAALNPILPKQCPCGYVDRTTDRLFTDAIIVYFNETQVIDPDVFTIRSFENKKEKGWFSTFRCGGRPSNVELGNNSSVQLFVDEYTSNHVVMGAELRTVRQDIQYGSFRASMRSPLRDAGGSALSMVLKHNGSESLALDLLNMDNPESARVTNLVNGELPADDLTVSYIALQDGLGMASSVNPWEFVHFRMDWTDYNVTFWANKTLTREVIPSNRSLPGIPMPLYLKHWSTGDSTYMQGPPACRSEANVAWIRAFFNSSLMTAEHHRVFDSRCQQSMACSMEDSRLRGSTPYDTAAKVAFREPPRMAHLRLPAALVAGICSVFGVFALINSFFRTVPWGKLAQASLRKKSEPHAPSSDPSSPPRPSRPSCESERGLVGPAEPDFLHPRSRGPYSIPSAPYRPELATPGLSTPGLDSQTTTNLSGTPYESSCPNFAEPIYLDFNAQAWDISSSRLSPLWYAEDVTKQEKVVVGATMTDLTTGDEIMPIDSGIGTIRAGAASELYSEDEKVDGLSGRVRVVRPSDESPPEDAMKGSTASPPVLASVAMPLTSQRRVDYLAGLIALSCLLVSIRHFVLTFWPFVALGYGNTAAHYAWERWASIFFGGYFLTPLWIGPFFITSSRFLSARYLREGDLADVAKKMLLRGPRLLIPVAIVAILEYFFISLGLVDTLVWLPSISWSTWPYVTPPRNFGVFANTILQLAYFIPNGAPEISGYFCTGVLWTIPVQLQFSYVVLLAAVMVRDMKNPRKRFGFYTWCIIAGWYARSWSACFWTGLLLTDLDVSYAWTRWTQSRPWVLYTVLAISTMVVLGTPLFLVFNLRYSFMILEAGIHPDVQTGMAQGDTPRGGYPDYFEPNLVILLFSTFIQIIADLSIWVQNFLATRPLLWLRRHVMTIYLVHGFIFWSLGAWLCVTLSAAEGLPYWANLLITLLVCYIVIAAVTVMMTPLIEFTTRSALKNIWRWSSEEPVPKIPTTGRFSKALVLDRSNLVAQTKEA